MNESMEQSLLSLQTIGNTFTQGICITDSKGIIVYVNTANERIFNIPAADAIGHSITEFTKGFSLAIQNAASLKSFENKDIYHGIATITSNKKNTLQFTAPILDSQNNILGFLITDQDIKRFLKIKETLENTDSKLISDKELQSDEFFRLTNPLIHHNPSDTIASRNTRYQNALYLAKQAAISDVTVLLYGETGCGKEIFANYIQSNSIRINKPFIKINCSAIPHNLLESELFGYTKGSFTGADSKGKPGYFELANQGTIFLDEIGELPMEFQAKLLRVLQERQVTRIGSTSPIDLDIKIIFATNRNLKEMVQSGAFREDLYYRINILPITIPPLRERLEDIPALTQYFLDKFNHKYNKHISFTPSVYINFKKYSWPGNVRELQNMIERWTVIHDEYAVIHWSQISSAFSENETLLSDYVSQSATLPTFNEMMDEYQREILLWAKSEYNTTREMAKALDLDHSTICKKAKKLNIILKDK